MKKSWIMGMLVAALLAVGVMGGTALANGSSSEGESPIKGLLLRVAEKLGLDEEQVQQAFQEASQEMRNEAIQGRLDAMVEAGHLTQEQADEYLEWYQSKPSFMSPGLPGMGFIKGRPWRGNHHRRGARFHQEEPITPITDNSGAISF